MTICQSIQWYTAPRARSYQPAYLVCQPVSMLFPACLLFLLYLAVTHFHAIHIPPLWYHTSRLEVVKHNREEGLVVEVLGMGSIAGCGSSGYRLCGRVLGGKYALWFWSPGWDSGLVCLVRLTCVAVRFSGCRPSWRAVRGSGFGRGWDEFPRLDWLASFLHSFFLEDEGSWLSISSLSCLWFYRDLLLTYGSPLALPVTLSYLGFLLDLLSSC